MSVKGHKATAPANLTTTPTASSGEVGCANQHRGNGINSSIPCGSPTHKLAQPEQASGQSALIRPLTTPETLSPMIAVLDNTSNPVPSSVERRYHSCSGTRHPTKQQLIRPMPPTQGARSNQLQLSDLRRKLQSRQRQPIRTTTVPIHNLSTVPLCLSPQLGVGARAGAGAVCCNSPQQQDLALLESGVVQSLRSLFRRVGVDRIKKVVHSTRGDRDAAIVKLLHMETRTEAT
jgi:hypothetical protein